MIATHAPPAIAPRPFPTVRILRLSTPPDEPSAVHIVSVFERAGHIVEQWHARRSSFGDRRTVILAEKFPGGDFTQVVGEDKAATQYPSPTSSFSNIRHSRILSKRKSFLSTSTHSLPSPAKTKTQPNQRSFDAIINFPPSSWPEKDILKHAMLVTSLSPSFLSSVPPLSTSTDPPKKRLSSIFGSTHVPDNHLNYDVHGVLAACSTHLIHILPPSASRTISPSSSSTSLSSQAAIPSLGNRSRPSIRTPSFISRQPSSTSIQPSSSSPALYIPSSHSSTSSVTHLHPHYQPISAPIHSRIGSQSSAPPCPKKPKLAQAIEHFLLSFAHSPTFPMPTHDLHGFKRKIVPYLLAPGVMGSLVQGNSNVGHNGTQTEVEILASEGRLTVGEVILLGLLDAPAKGDDFGKSSKSVAELSARAWIGEAQQVVLASKGGTKAKEDMMAPLARLRPLAVPVPACSPSGREKERDGSMIKDDSSSESPTLTLNRYSPPMRSSSPQSDKSSITKPLPALPKVPVCITPPIGSDDPHNGLATPPDSSTENGGTEFETCETYATVIDDFGAHLKSVSDPGSYDPYQAAFLDPNWSTVGTQFGLHDVQPTKTGLMKGLGFKKLSKALSLSGKAASPISTMAMSTIVQRRSVLRRERDVLRPVVV